MIVVFFFSRQNNMSYLCIVVIKNYSVCCGQIKPAQAGSLKLITIWKSDALMFKNDYYMEIRHINGTNNYYMKIGDIYVSLMSPIFI